MPTLDQLALKYGYTKTDDQAPSLSELLEQSDEIKGLKDSKFAIKGEKEALEADFKAKLEEKDAAYEELAKKHNDSEQLAAIKEKKANEAHQAMLDKMKSLEDGLNASRERTQKAALEAAQASVASLMNDPIYGKYYAEKSAVVELNELGEPITKFKFGEQVFDKLDDWKQAAIKDETVASKIAVGGANNAPSANGQQGGQGGGQQPQQPKLSNATKGYMANLQS